LLDEILGEIISLLPTKDGAATQALASWWRHLWLSAPLNLDISNVTVYEDALSRLISRILGVHPGPARRFSIPPRDLSYCPTIVDACLRSLAVDNLQELELEVQSHGHRCWVLLPPYHHASSCPCYSQMWLPLPASAFRFSATLRVATVSKILLEVASLKTYSK
ncbi:hypothetical protein BAE44_0025619, partial [Dichanthelium oligosanthes]